ncbi:MAG TPA: alpha/beta hydrolase, partial [Ilumatobacteraceae bacterium]
RRMAAGVFVAVVVVAGCASTSAGVQIARSDIHHTLLTAPQDTEPTDTFPPATQPADSLPADSIPVSTDPTGTGPTGTAPTGTGPAGTGVPAAPDVVPVQWGSCTDQPAPWQCATISVPMDYSSPSGKQISIALNRLPAADPAKRIGSLVVNPGGPGGSGIQLAQEEGPNFPQAILDSFDIVGFDPRGVGASTPVQCPTNFDPESGSYARCIRLTGAYLSYLGTPNVARDLDRIRAAIGDAKLTYLGFSYGTALGGVYADMFPQNVRAMVLDGSVDPTAGRVNTTMDFTGDDFYVEQDFDTTIGIFADLCNATTLCAAGPHASDLIDSVEAEVRRLPTQYFTPTTRLDRDEVDNIVVSAMYNVSYWPMLAVALKDAADGDASTLAAFDSYLQFGYPANMDDDPSFDFANLAIRCADFAGRGNASDICRGFPDTATPLPEITAANGVAPIVVVGTRGDPATPWRYSGQLASALGNAVSITWEGAGHTAFLTSSCITDAVTKYVVDLDVPANQLDCPFVVGATTLAQRADRVFGDANRASEEDQMTDVLVAKGDSEADAKCVSTKLGQRNNEELIVHELLGVDTPDLVGIRTLIEKSCAGGG